MTALQLYKVLVYVHNLQLYSHQLFLMQLQTHSSPLPSGTFYNTAA